MEISYSRVEPGGFNVIGLASTARCGYGRAWSVTIFSPTFDAVVDATHPKGYVYTSIPDNRGNVFTITRGPSTSGTIMGPCNLLLALAPGEALLLEAIFSGARPIALGETIDTEQPEAVPHVA